MEIDTGYDTISDKDLDQLVQQYCKENPTAEQSYMLGHLRAVHNLRIQHHRITNSLNHIDQLGQGVQQCIGKKEQRHYYVPHPNALWHIDGHHKLILWGIVIYGVNRASFMWGPSVFNTWIEWLWLEVGKWFV